MSAARGPALPARLPLPAARGQLPTRPRRAVSAQRPGGEGIERGGGGGSVLARPRRPHIRTVCCRSRLCARLSVVRVCAISEPVPVKCYEVLTPVTETRTTLADAKGDAIRQWVEEAAALALTAAPTSPVNNNNKLYLNNNDVKGRLVAAAAAAVARRWSPPTTLASPLATPLATPLGPPVAPGPPSAPTDDQPLDFSVIRRGDTPPTPGSLGNVATSSPAATRTGPPPAKIRRLNNNNQGDDEDDDNDNASAGTSTATSDDAG